MGAVVSHRITTFVALVLTAMTAFCGCSGSEAISSPPYIPPNYYNCIEVKPIDLLKAYSVNYGDVTFAEQQYTNQVFVIKTIYIDRMMLTDADTFTYETIMFTALVPGSVAQLRDGETIDIVGINRGMMMEYPGWLKFTDCLFLPAGSVQLPTPGGPAFAPLY